MDIRTDSADEQRNEVPSPVLDDEDEMPNGGNTKQNCTDTRSGEGGIIVIELEVWFGVGRHWNGRFLGWGKYSIGLVQRVCGGIRRREVEKDTTSGVKSCRTPMQC